MHGDNFSYLIADETTKEAVIIDPGFDTDELQTMLNKEDLHLTLIINTHDHIDHVVGNDALKLRLGAKTVSHQLSKITTDARVNDGDLLKLGNIVIKILYTPGHSADSISLLVDDKKLMTGDVLFVGRIGNSHLSGGDPKSLYDSLFGKLLNLADDVEVYPPHDRGTKPSSTLGEEKRSNTALKSQSYEEFVESTKQT